MKCIVSSDIPLKFISDWVKWLNADYWDRTSVNYEIPDLSSYDLILLYFIRTGEIDLVNKIRQKYPKIKIVVHTDSCFWWLTCPWLAVAASISESKIINALRDADLFLTILPLTYKFFSERNIKCKLDFYMPHIPSYIPPIKTLKQKERKAAIMFHSMPNYNPETNLQATKKLGLTPVLIGTFQNSTILKYAINRVGFSQYEIYERFKESKPYMEKLSECLVGLEDWYAGGSRFTIECAISGTPVVGSENALSLKILSPELTCKNGDVNCLVEKASLLINDEHLYTSLSKKIRKTALNYFGEEETRKRFMKMIDEIW